MKIKLSTLQGNRKDPVAETASAIRRAKVSVCAAVYKFDAAPVRKELQAALKRGVKVKLVVARWVVKRAERKNRWVKKLHEDGARVRVWRSGKLHAKFTIVDSKRVLSGSYNWTKSAAKKNVELRLSSDDTAVVVQFDRHFRYLWSRGKRLK